MKKIQRTVVLLPRVTTLKILGINAFLYKNAFFPAQPQRCLIFSWIELQMLLRYCSIYITIIILRHILFLAYLYPYLELVLHMSYLCDLFFFFSLIFVTINHIISFTLTYLFFIFFLEYLVLFLRDNVNKKSE